MACVSLLFVRGQRPPLRRRRDQAHVQDAAPQMAGGAEVRLLQVERVLRTQVEEIREAPERLEVQAQRRQRTSAQRVAVEPGADRDLERLPGARAVERD